MKTRAWMMLPLLALAFAGCQREAASPPSASSDGASATPPAEAAASPAPPPASGTESPTPAATDWTLPGDFAPDTTVAQLKARFGEANVRIVDDLPMAEGETTRGVILFPEDPSRRATLYFQDTRNLAGLQGVNIDDAGSRWHYASGVRIGMTLAELAALNGAPVSFYGLSWDYGGHVIGFNGGKLGDAEGRPGRDGMRLGIKAGAKDGDYPVGDREFRSDDPKWPKAGRSLAVSELMLSLPGEDDL